MEAKISKVQGWILERLEWVEKMPHSYLKEHLTKELKAAKDAHTEAIQQRIDTARADAAEARESLCDALDGRASEIEEFAADASQSLGGYALASTLGFGIAIEALNKQFDDAA